MAESGHTSTHISTATSNTSHPLPPPAPPLPPSRTVLQRIIAPLSFNIGARPHGSHSTHSSSASPRHVPIDRIYKQLPSQTTAHRTGIPISALDLNKEKTHAILAGQEILKTVHVFEGRIVEDFNLRSAINSSASTYGPRSDATNQRREYLPAKDVRWSHGSRYDTIVATAALNGRIMLYDVSRINSSRIELAWIHEHTGQVNKLDFDPFGGYLLLSGSQDKTVKIWDIRDPKTVLRKQSINVRHPIRDVKWSPTDVGEFALCTESGIIQRWDLRMPSQALLSINAHEKACYTIDWHPDGRHLVSGGFDKYAKVWDFKSENRRQKPAFQLRTPQAVMNIRWRPACWSSEMSETGTLQSTQLATGYTDDDPRVHVWDLRRPLIPFRELDRYNSRPTDLVWASKDTLWTVGNEGMFTQTDVRYAAHVHDEISPCAMDFMPDGSFITFTEDLRRRPGPTLDDPSAAFLRIPHEKLSGATDDMNSRSVSDEEIDEDILNHSSRRRQSKTASSRSAKSQGNTPPTNDNLSNVLSLDQSVLGRTDLFNNDQWGTASNIEGIAAEPYVVEFLATNYARPSTIEERKSEPSMILKRLEEAFMHNADACDYASLYRQAQSWRILCAVIVPELRNWADRNRKARLEAEVKRRASSIQVNAPTISPRVTDNARNTDSRPSARSSKVKTHLFKGVATSEFTGHESVSTSNMTTPVAVPLPDSPYSRHGEPQYLSLNESAEPVVPLPPAVMNSHSTAAAASKALFDDDDDNNQNNSPQSSPEIDRQHASTSRNLKGNAADTSPRSTNKANYSRSPLPQPTTSSGSGSFSRIVNPRNPSTQEDRRAAIRDYRAQARPLFTLEAPISSPQYGAAIRYDSTDSFSMFSASTDSSQRNSALQPSYGSDNRVARARHDSEDWQDIKSSDLDDSTPPSGSSGKAPQQTAYHHQDFENSKVSVDFAMDDAPGFSFGTDGLQPIKPPMTRSKPSASAKLWDLDDLGISLDSEQPETVASSASEPLFHFEQVHAAPRTKIYTSNPIRRMASKKETAILQSIVDQDLTVKDDSLMTKDYVYSDFTPIDFTVYEPELPFAWSALPLICHTIAFDTDEGIACAQFSVHLLMHLHPFFFNQAFRVPLQSSIPAPDTMAERLMRPDLSHRVIESLFAGHITYLKKMRLFVPMAELRLVCVQFDYPAVYRLGQTEQPVGSSLKQDPFQLQVSCSRCHTLMATGSLFCQNCGMLRDACPICQLVHADQKYEAQDDTNHLLASSNLWTFCQACGHGAHLTCMQQWILHPESHGTCPTRNCTCDCGPGLVRQTRLNRQITEAANAEIIRGARGVAAVTKKDPMKASPSPAVDKTRDTLRHLDLRDRDRAVQGGDEDAQHNINTNTGNNQENSRGHGNGNGSGNTSRGPGGSRGSVREGFGNRRVRLVTPREEGES